MFVSLLCVSWDLFRTLLCCVLGLFRTLLCGVLGSLEHCYMVFSVSLDTVMWCLGLLRALLCGFFCQFGTLLCGEFLAVWNTMMWCFGQFVLFGFFFYSLGGWYVVF